MSEGQMGGSDAPGEQSAAPVPPEHVRGVTLIAATTTILGRSPGTVQQDEQVLVPFTRHNDVVLLPGARARQVITALERAGVDGDRISFLRLDDRSLSDDLDATPSPRLDVGGFGEEPDERSVVVVALICGLIGAALIGLVVWLLSDASSAAWGALGGLVLGGALGGLWGSFRRLGASDAWERSLHTEAGAFAALGVHLDDPEGNHRVTEILTPFGVWVFGYDGSVLRRPSAV